MPEKITILKDSGESINSNIVSVFMIPESNKEYIITTENAVDPHGLTVLHVSEIKGDTLVKVETDEEWSSIKTIMRAIISSSVGSYQYLVSLDNAKASGQYSRDISVSAAAAKQMVDSYTSGEKVSPAVPEVEEPEPQGDSIFPTAPAISSDDEVVPGIAEVAPDEPTEIQQTDAQPVVGVGSGEPLPPVSPAVDESVVPVADEPVVSVDVPVDTPAVAEGDAQPPVIDVAVPQTENESVVPEAALIPGQEVEDVSQIDTVVPVENSVMNEFVQNPELSEQSLVNSNVIPVETTDQTTIEAPIQEVPGQIMSPTDVNIDMSTMQLPQDNVANVNMAMDMASVPPVVDVNNVPPVMDMNSVPSVEDINNVADVNNVPPVIDNNQVPVDGSGVPPVVGVAPVAVPSAEPVIPPASDDAMMAQAGMVPNGDMMQQNVGEQIPGSANMNQQYYQQPTSLLPQTPVTSALQNMGITIDFYADPSLNSKASFDEVVAGAQELFQEGVKNLIMVMSERMYRDLKAKEEDLKRREVIVAQREQAINEKTMAMMNVPYSQPMQGQQNMGMPNQSMMQQPMQQAYQQPNQMAMQGQMMGMQGQVPMQQAMPQQAMMGQNPMMMQQSYQQPNQMAMQGQMMGMPNQPVQSNMQAIPTAVQAPNDIVIPQA